ncbi:MAG TPA: hypothetical protein VD838_21735 [Anaeromyxobacteraceae bacterium]|nr:hypothetical protein [Anaeromyxobacteraceae bacterium]
MIDLLTILLLAVGLCALFRAPSEGSGCGGDCGHCSGGSDRGPCSGAVSDRDGAAEPVVQLGRAPGKDVS